MKECSTNKCVVTSAVVAYYFIDPKDMVFNHDGTVRMKRKYGNKKRIVTKVDLTKP